MKLRNGLDLLVIMLQTPLYWSSFVMGLIVDSVRYGFWVGFHYWDD